MASPLLILTLVVPLSTAPETPAQSTDTSFENVHVAAMVQYKMSEKMILYVIQTRPTKFDTSPAALDALRALGVSETILRAMVAASPPPAVPDRAAAAPVPPAGEQPARPITNADVVAMVKAGLPEDAIIASLHGKPTSFDTSPDALISLKNQGATDNLVRAVVAASQPPPTGPGPAAAVAVTEPPFPVPPLLAGQFAVGQPSAVLIRGEEREPLTASTAQVAQVKAKLGDDFASIAATMAAEYLVLELGAKLMASTAIGLGSTAAGALAGPLVAASMLFHKAPTYTFLLALPGSQAPTKLQGSELAVELRYDGIPGVDPDALEPLLLELSATKNNLRLVRAQKLKLKDGGFEAGKEKVLQAAVPATVRKLDRGHVILEATGLAPGEYGIILRNTGPAEALLYPQSGFQPGGGDVTSTVWDFSLSPEEAKPNEE